MHTPESHLYNDFGNDWDAYVKALFSAAIGREIAAIGITDYFTIDGYKKLTQDYLQNDDKLSSLFSAAEIAAIRDILILPNIEFRLRPLAGQRVNFHVIFSDQVSPSTIEEHFLHDLEFTYEGEPQQTAKTKKLKLSNIETLGKKLRGEHQHFAHEGDDIYIGMKNAVVDEQQIVSVLDKERDNFSGKYLVGVVADEDLSKIDWNSQDHQTRKVLIQMSDFLVASNPKTCAWALGQESVYKEGPDEFVKEFKTLKPCVHGSDAHAVWELFHPCAKRGEATHSCEADANDCLLRYCWIKADRTFEGLKQIVYESGSRVRLSPSSPAPVKSSYSLERYEIAETPVNEELSISATSILMNPDLIAVIGGRGRGKTAFVDLLSHNYSDQRDTDNANSFVQRLRDDANGLQTRLNFLNGDTFSKTLADGNHYGDSAITYIAQGDLERYLGDDLDKYVHDLVFGRVSDTVLDFEFSNLEDDISSVEEKLEQAMVESARLVKATKPEKHAKLLGEKRAAEGRLKDLGSLITAFEAKRSKEQLEAARLTQEKLARLKERRDLLKQALDVARTGQRFLEEDLRSFNLSIEALRKNLETLHIEHSLPDLQYRAAAALTKIAETLQSRLKDTVGEIDHAQKAIRVAKDETAKHARLLDEQAKEQKTIADLDERLAQFSKDQEQLARFSETRRALLARLIGKILDLRCKYDEIVATFSEDKDEVLTDISFEAEIRYERDRMLESADDLLDSRSVTVLLHESRPSEFAQLLTYASALELWESSKDPAELVNAYVGEISRLIDELAPRLRKAEGIELLDFYRVMYRRYFLVTPRIKYRNTDLRNLSLGQKATVLIKIYLAQGEEPIIIDSHDDHLDNEFIMEELVQAVRKAKEYRQVILVSNNGNLVVNSDAEQLVIAERDASGGISYQCGALENSAIRSRALEVLEGGLSAFQKREQKYRMGDHWPR